MRPFDWFRHVTAVMAISMLTLQAGAAPGALAPDFSLSEADGTNYTLAVAKAPPVRILFFWATWCPYCKALMPHLQSLRYEYRESVEILAINVFEDGDPAKFLENGGYDFRLLVEGDEVAKAYGLKGTPGIVIVDSERNVAFDLRELAGDPNAPATRSAQALAPYWAAAIRRGVDTLIER